MAAAPCPRCSGTCDESANFCVRCGLDLQAAAQPAPPPDEDVARFVTCPVCGAPNAASRRRCGRCKAGFDGQPPPPPPPPVGATPAGRPAPEPVEPGSRVVFGAALSIAALAILGVIATLLSGNGIGVFADAVARTQPDDGETILGVSSIRASSVLAPDGDETHEPELLLDDDPTTAWREAASGDGVGEWVELQLAGTPDVSRLLLWNGHQREDRYDGTTRASQVRIDLGERTFTADLLDVTGPQAVELPEVVAASSVRLTILAVTPGDGDLALSGLEVRGPPPQTAPDVEGEASG